MDKKLKRILFEHFDTLDGLLDLLDRSNCPEFGFFLIASLEDWFNDRLMECAGKGDCEGVVVWADRIRELEDVHARMCEEVEE